MTHEVIVYRNPLEKAMWDFWLGTETGNAIVTFGCFIVLTILFLYVIFKLFLERPYNRLMWKWRQRRGIGGVNHYSRTRF